MEKKNIAIFFNNIRGLEVYKFLNKKKKYNFDVYLSKKNLNKSLLKKLKNYKLINKIDSTVVKKIKAKQYYLNITAGWPLKFPIDLIRSSLKGTINLHAGKLPEYRGGSPLNWQIIEGKKKIFISIIKMSKGWDTGPIYSQRSIKLKSSESIRELHKKVNFIYPKMTEKVINNIIKGIEPAKQSKKNARYLKQRSDKDGKIDWKNMSSTKVFNLVRALNEPYPGAFYTEKKKIIRILKCKKIKNHTQLDPGEILYKKNKKIIKCKYGFIKILKQKKSI